MLDESQIIALFFDSNATPVNDCAYLSEDSLLVTGDSMAEHTHFELHWHSPDLLAKKLFQSNLSDIAAGGGDPRWCLLQLGLPTDADEEYLSKFAHSLKHECLTHRCQLIGGDTFRNHNWLLAMTMAGKTNRPFTRGASPGDAIYLTGSVGLSLAGFRQLKGELLLTGSLRDKALQRHLAPQARLEWSRAIRNHATVHGMMDVSDGLILDLERFARAAGMCFLMHLESVPFDPELEGYLSPLECATSGEEYELLFTGPSGLRFDFPAVEIGRVAVPDRRPIGLHIFSDMTESEEITPNTRGFEHF